MKLNKLLILVISLLSSLASAADAVAPASPTSGLFKMMLGLIIVLAVMAGIAYLAKKMLPGIGHQQSAIQVIGSVNVGTRERVVVLEVAGRWLVVGVAQGNVSAIANLEVGAKADADNTTRSLDAQTNSIATAFAAVLKKSASKFTEKTNG